MLCASMLYCTMYYIGLQLRICIEFCLGNFTSHQLPLCMFYLTHTEETERACNAICMWGYYGCHAILTPHGCHALRFQRSRNNCARKGARGQGGKGARGQGGKGARGQGGKGARGQGGKGARGQGGKGARGGEPVEVRHENA